jgi:predicted Zn-dependent protease
LVLKITPARREFIRAYLAILFIPLLFGIAFNVESACVSEQQAAQTMLQKIDNEWPMRGSGDAVSQYVQRLGERLANVGDYRHYHNWRFSVVRNLAPNAFSIGDGYVFITDGAVKFTQNESELAAILAHEIGHQLAGHFCNTHNNGDLFDIFSPLETQQQQQVGVGSMTQLIDPVKEQQADQVALSILQSSGYNPHAMLDITRRLPAGGAAHLMDTNRIQFLEYTLANSPPSSISSSDEFQSMKRILSAE